MRKELDALLKYAGFRRRYKGYHYFLTCLELAVEHEERLSAVTKEIYMPVANQHHTDYRCVERDIRTVCEHAWKHGGKEVFEEKFQRKWDKIPSGLNFIELMLELYKNTNG